VFTKEEIEKKMVGYPILEYAFFDPQTINFYPNVRKICEMECPQYGKSWSCPPAVGTLEECKDRCLSFEHAFIFSTVSEVDDMMNMEAMLVAQKEHNQIIRQIHRDVFDLSRDVLIMSAESCKSCDTCTYPEAACFRPDQMYPCIESQTILVTEICEEQHLSFMNGHNVVTWFCLILY
jgi:predicted metal-binding protein